MITIKTKIKTINIKIIWVIITHLHIFYAVYLTCLHVHLQTYIQKYLFIHTCTNLCSHNTLFMKKNEIEKKYKKITPCLRVLWIVQFHLVVCWYSFYFFCFIFFFFFNSFNNMCSCFCLLSFARLLFYFCFLFYICFFQWYYFLLLYIFQIASGYITLCEKEKKMGPF